MSSDASEQVMALLNELAVLKERNKQYEANPSRAEQEAHLDRQRRQEEITQAIKALAEEKASEPSAIL